MSQENSNIINAFTVDKMGGRRFWRLSKRGPALLSCPRRGLPEGAWVATRESNHCNNLNSIKRRKQPVRT